MQVTTKIAMQLFMIEAFAKYSCASYIKEDMVDKEDNKFLSLSVAALTFARREIREIKMPKKQRERVVNRLKNKVDLELKFLREIEGGKSSPQILMLLVLDRLVNLSGYKRAKIIFRGFDFGSYYDMIFSKDNYKEHLKKHNDFIEKALR